MVNKKDIQFVSSFKNKLKSIECYHWAFDIFKTKISPHLVRGGLNTFRYSTINIFHNLSFNYFYQTNSLALGVLLTPEINELDTLT
jgi:hypothetical protein